MASMRDAMRRLQVVYEACAPEPTADEGADGKKIDEFTRIRKKIHLDVKEVRNELKEREEIMSLGGTTTESAEKSYRIRVAIRALKEQASRMAEIVAKEERKKKKDPESVANLAQRREILDLCQKHIEECENLEKRRFNEGHVADRSELLAGARPPERRRGRGNKAADPEEPPPDPFTNTDLPDIDVEEDFKRIGERNKLIDNDLDQIGAGVAKLKELANEMGNELDRQNEQLDNIERGVDGALDRVDNLNVKMRVAVDKVMKGDRFIVNCVLMCVVLALVAFISGQFAT
ncbi:uncharacterized protein EV422DRAFT_535864 [Fimicolochytrium jonesii]|uniref:uncharacterized protein n=1 Tax=Fimicolochytrium jonesii TaxID=1396493 RepID=UPI0022FEE9FC|nr:uncharacterized protein EV422DRAFT_535864 [Fimicolochytrium jonesii]KAI8818903.1 hypothetical protein EV422DRAFT_535864 [Fimicolochytrium jonesii]